MPELRIWPLPVVLNKQDLYLVTYYQPWQQVLLAPTSTQLGKWQKQLKLKKKLSKSTVLVTNLYQTLKALVITYRLL